MEEISKAYITMIKLIMLRVKVGRTVCVLPVGGGGYETSDRFFFFQNLKKPNQK